MVIRSGGQSPRRARTRRAEGTSSTTMRMVRSQASILARGIKLWPDHIVACHTVLTKVFVYSGIGIVAVGVLPVMFEVLGWGVKTS